MSLLIQAIHQISALAHQADVDGVPRVSITFDRPSDRERFKAECKRQIEASQQTLFGNGPMDLSECTIAGVKVRII